jgi:hypothetical protein
METIVEEKNDKEERLLMVLNNMLSCVGPVTYGDFNKVFPAIDIEKLREFEKEDDAFGSARYGTPMEGISTLSIIATITDILMGKRLGVVLEPPSKPETFDPSRIPIPIKSDEASQKNWSKHLIIRFQFVGKISKGWGV